MFVVHINFTAEPGVSNANHEGCDGVLNKVQHGALCALLAQQGPEPFAVGLTQKADQGLGSV